MPNELLPMCFDICWHSILNLKIMNASVFFLASSLVYSQNSSDLTSDTSLMKFFNATEVESLGSAIGFVDELVLNKTNTTDANEAYHLYFEELARTENYSAPFKENEKYKFLDAMDASTFNAIWTFDSSNLSVIPYKDTVYRNLKDFKELRILYQSKYMDYLEDVGKEDSYFKSLRELIDAVGNMSAATAYEFPKNHADFDFNIPKNRLWAAIFLLTQEENLELKLDRYFRNPRTTKKSSDN